jgi:hypothetical protein
VDADGIPNGSGPFESELNDAHFETGRVYTADNEMTDIELTISEQDQVRWDYLEKKLGKDHPYFTYWT